MKCSELQKNDIVVFKVNSLYESEKIFDGNVVFVNHDKQTVDVIYLEGYKSRNDTIPYSNMLAKYDPNGEMMTFGGYIKGNSVLLEE